MNKKNPEEVKLKEVNYNSYFNNLLKNYENIISQRDKGKIINEKAAADLTPAGGTLIKK